MLDLLALSSHALHNKLVPALHPRARISSEAFGDGDIIVLLDRSHYEYASVKQRVRLLRPISDRTFVQARAEDALRREGGSRPAARELFNFASKSSGARRVVAGCISEGGLSDCAEHRTAPVTIA